MENTDNKNTQQKKVSWGGVGLGYMGLAIMVAYVVALYKQAQADRGEYIITDKENYKIVYAPISDRTDLHVMEFGPFDTDTLWYKYMNVGDTIVGNKSFFGQPVVDATHTVYGKNIDFRVSNFSTVNGQSTPDIRQRAARDNEIARRDSIIRTMRQNQK